MPEPTPSPDDLLVDAIAIGVWAPIGHVDHIKTALDPAKLQVRGGFMLGGRYWVRILFQRMWRYWTRVDKTPLTCGNNILYRSDAWTQARTF